MSIIFTCSDPGYRYRRWSGRNACYEYDFFESCFFRPEVRWGVVWTQKNASINLYIEPNRCTVAYRVQWIVLLISSSRCSKLRGKILRPTRQVCCNTKSLPWFGPSYGRQLWCGDTNERSARTKKTTRKCACAVRNGENKNLKNVVNLSKS